MALWWQYRLITDMDGYTCLRKFLEFADNIFIFVYGLSCDYDEKYLRIMMCLDENEQIQNIESGYE